MCLVGLWSLARLAGKRKCAKRRWPSRFELPAASAGGAIAAQSLQPRWISLRETWRWPNQLSSAPGCLGNFFCQRAIFANRCPKVPVSVFSAVVGALRGAARALSFSTCCGVSGMLLGGGPRRRRLAGVTGAGGEGGRLCAMVVALVLAFSTRGVPAALLGVGTRQRCLAGVPGAGGGGSLLVRSCGGRVADHQGELHRTGGLAEPPGSEVG